MSPPTATPAPVLSTEPEVPWRLHAGWVLLVIGLVTLIYGPRLVDAHFGLLDDGITLLNARNTLEHPLSPLTDGRGSGRFFPNYLWHYTIYYVLARTSAAGFYFLHLIFLAGTAWLLLLLTRAFGARRSQSALAVALFLICGATVTTFHTLSKAEVPQLFWLVAALVLCYAGETLGTRRSLALATVCLTLSLLSKETALAIFPVTALWFALDFVAQRRTGEGQPGTRRFLLAALATGVCYMLLYLTLNTGLAAKGSYGGNYRLSLDRIEDTAIVELSFFLRSFAYCLPLLAVLPLAWKRLTPATRRGVLRFGILWACFCAILLPWTKPLDYLYLVADAGLACALGFLLPEIYRLARTEARTKAWVIRAAFAVSVVLMPLNLLNSYTDAHAQLLVDRQNAALLDRLRALPRDARVAVNWWDNENLIEIRLFLKDQFGRGDIQLATFNGDRRAWAAGGTYYLLNPVFDQGEGLLPRLGIAANGARTLTVSLRKWMASMDDVKKETLTDREWLMDAAFHRAFCSETNPQAGGTCSEPRPFLWERTVTYGWELYEINVPAMPPLQFARFTSKGNWEFLENGRVIHRLAFGRPGDVALSADFVGQGEQQIAVFHPADGAWQVDLNLDGRPEASFRLPDTRPGDVPIAGDWDNDGRATPGLYRPATGEWRMWDNLPPSGAPRVMLKPTLVTDRPLPLKWLGRKLGTLPAMYRRAGEMLATDDWIRPGWGCAEGAPPNAQPIVADWSGLGIEAASFLTGGHVEPRVMQCGARFVANPASIQLDPAPYYFAGRWKLPGRP